MEPGLAGRGRGPQPVEAGLVGAGPTTPAGRSGAGLVHSRTPGFASRGPHRPGAPHSRHTAVPSRSQGFAALGRPYPRGVHFAAWWWHSRGRPAAWRGGRARRADQACGSRVPSCPNGGSEPPASRRCRAPSGGRSPAQRSEAREARQGRAVRGAHARGQTGAAVRNPCGPPGPSRARGAQKGGQRDGRSAPQLTGQTLPSAAPPSPRGCWPDVPDPDRSSGPGAPLSAPASRPRTTLV